MFVFLDFEASSLAKKSYPIEVAWVFEDGTEESHLIRPPLQWSDWDDEAEAIHHITRAEIEANGTPHDVVAQRMIAVLSGHALFASAPSWDGKWLSALLRAAKQPRHALRLRDSEEAQRETATAILRGWCRMSNWGGRWPMPWCWARCAIMMCRRTGRWPTRATNGVVGGW